MGATTTDAGTAELASDSEKTYSNIRAAAARHGQRVHRLDSAGGFVVVGPGGWCSREVRSLAELAGMLRQMGVVL